MSKPIYHQTLADIENDCRAYAKTAGYEVEFLQSNIEGEIVNHIQEASSKGIGLIINPAAYTHTSVAIHDALKSVAVPAVEVHLSQPAKRESFRLKP